VPHATPTLGGWIWYAAIAVVWASVAFAVFVLADSFRARRLSVAEELGRNLWLYRAGEGVFLGVVAVAQIPGVPAILRGIAVALIPLALAQGVTYLLRVVYPAGGSELPPPGEGANDTASS
jgi:hypothetical protein